MEGQPGFNIQKSDFPNLKGVMLCARPDEKQNIERDRQFCSRVNPKEMIGVNPVLKFRNLKTRKRPNHASIRHKQWLKGFGQEMKHSQSEAIDEQTFEVDKFFRIREREAFNRRSIIESQKNNFQDNDELAKTQQTIRHNFRNSQIDYETLLNNIKNDVDSVGRVKAERPPFEQNFLAPDQTAKPNTLQKMALVPRESSTPLLLQSQKIDSNSKTQQKSKNKKIVKRRPAWTQSEQQLACNDDELITFMQELDVDQFLEDLEVKSLVSSIQDRIQKLQENGSRTPDQKFDSGALLDHHTHDSFCVNQIDEEKHQDYHTNQYNDSILRKKLAVNPKEPKFFSQDTLKLQKARNQGLVMIKRAEHSFG